MGQLRGWGTGCTHEKRWIDVIHGHVCEKWLWASCLDVVRCFERMEGKLLFVWGSLKLPHNPASPEFSYFGFSFLNRGCPWDHIRGRYKWCDIIDSLLIPSTGSDSCFSMWTRCCCYVSACCSSCCCGSGCIYGYDLIRVVVVVVPVLWLVLVFMKVGLHTY